MTKVKQNNKGITLIALVVTIVVLLILAGITITAVIGDNGLINRAKTAAEKSGDSRCSSKNGSPDGYTDEAYPAASCRRHAVPASSAAPPERPAGCCP